MAMTSVGHFGAPAAPSRRQAHYGEREVWGRGVADEACFHAIFAGDLAYNGTRRDGGHCVVL